MADSIDKGCCQCLVEEITRVGNRVGKAPPLQQLIIGCLLGWPVGFMSVKFGKNIAFAVGGGLLAFQVLTYENGRRKSLKDKITRKVDAMGEKLDRKIFGAPDNIPSKSQVKQFINDHSLLVGGFAAGILLGIGTPTHF